jgi:ABC-2 type transport system ATP-binding protein/lipopolysaccharide transport system ATP-binding protein
MGDVDILAEPVIKVEDVGMKFFLSKERTDNLKEYVIKFIKRELDSNEFWALKNISFELEKGDKLGLMGLNGAGKSTLLKIICGVLRPTEGNVEVNGNIVPLLTLGGGFSPDYTGRENVYLNGSLYGYPKSFIEKKFDEIVDFAEIEDFIDVPVKNYSSGMRARLAFSIATIVEPEILIVDEILSVGDATFQAKSMDKMNSLIKNDTTLLFVSHSIGMVRKICDKSIWLDKGNMVMKGSTTDVSAAYEKKVLAGIKSGSISRLNINRA